jgi:16S rRNA (uracil1498-N3)-methyltransferase
MTRRRWIADTWNATTATLTGEQAEHLARVLRAAPGQIYDVVAGGFLHRAEIVSVQPAEIVFTLHEELESDTALPLHLLLAVFKFDHMEWAIEKATELGVARITPILARRTEKHLAQAAQKRVERWRRIALEASKQSRRTTIPEISEPAPLKAILETANEPVRLLLSETEQNVTIASALKSAPLDSLQDYALAIGPEGGWTPEEMALFTQHAWQPVTLGPRILRAETAAIAAIAILSSQIS